MDFHNFRKGLQLGAAAGVAIGVSSFHHTHSASRSMTIGIAVALIGAAIWGAMEQRSEVERRSHGITLKEIPLRPIIRLEFSATPGAVMAACRDALLTSGFRLKRVEIDEPARLVVLTRVSRKAWGERVAMEVKDNDKAGCSLEITSVPRLSTTTRDRGANYMNTFLLAKFIKNRLSRDYIGEELM